MKAPDFSLQDQQGQTHSLADYKGKWLIVYFYPKDDTPGCTKEACSFRDSFAELKQMGVSLIGVSKDPLKMHVKFASKFELPFPILSDESHAVIEAYGAWGDKMFMGKRFQGTLRNTVIVNPEGEIDKVYEKVSPDEHVAEVIEYLKTRI